MSFVPEKLYFRLASAFFMIFCFAVLGMSAQAQSRKSSARQKGKEKETADRDKRREADKKKDKDKKDTRAGKDDSKAKNKKPSKAELAREAEERRRDAERRREAERREEERRQAALAEKRRREQAAREARERALAFERGLKNETRENILRDDISGEDLEVRRAAVNALGNHAGTVVVMEAQTGKVLSIVNQEWAIRKGFKPCSTIKLVTGVAGLNEKQIEEDGTIRGRNFPMNLDDALAHSNNSYFQRVGTNVGNQKMISYARALGLGEQTGINAPAENPGRLPFGNNNPRIYSHGDDFKVTPLQLGVMVSALSNGGKKIIPQIPRTSVEKTNFRGAMRGEVNLPQENLQGVLPGMIGAVNYGTARRSQGSEFNAAGKTGSCIDEGTWVGLFASVAPVVNPQYAVVVITRGAGERGKYASAIAGKIYQTLGSRIRANSGNREFIANKLPLQLKPQSKVNAKTSALVDNDEGEDSDEGDVNPAPVKKESHNQPAAKSSTVFDPVVIQVNKLPSRPRIVPNRP